jgi:Fic family protein
MGHMKSFEPKKPYNALPFLPPDTTKTETAAILKQESRALHALGELKGFANIIPNQSILINAIVLQEAKDSSEIENIITTQDDLYKAVSVTISKADPAAKEVMFYREALYKGFTKIRTRGLLSINDIIDVQRLLIQNDAGIRNTSGTALVNDRTHEVIYTPPDDYTVINDLLKNFVEYLNGDDPTLAKLAILHYQFETIHPFHDGNGRTGRIINMLYLILKEYLDIPILYLSSYIIRNKARYYELLLSVTKDDAWEDWVLFILTGIEETAKETLLKIRRIRDLLDSTISNVKDKVPGIYSKELVETLFVNPYCKGEFLVASLGVERKTAARYLQQLESSGILESVKVGTERIFIHKELIQLLKE